MLKRLSLHKGFSSMCDSRLHHSNNKNHSIDYLSEKKKEIAKVDKKNSSLFLLTYVYLILGMTQFCDHIPADKPPLRSLDMLSVVGFLLNSELHSSLKLKEPRK